MEQAQAPPRIVRAIRGRRWRVIAEAAEGRVSDDDDGIFGRAGALESKREAEVPDLTYRWKGPTVMW